MENQTKGLIHVYTGDGKGKTTAAAGLALRAKGQGLKVCYVYFHKDPAKWGYTEHKTLRKLGVKVRGFAAKHPFCDKDADKTSIRQKCLKGLAFVKKAYLKNGYDLLILDEINISLRDGFLKIPEVLTLLAAKPTKLELVLTGRGAPAEIIAAADLVSEIKKVKHPYDRGIPRRKGIEY
ncbi:MAG: cob(I)yrinic acid a,c-diamide adenosyltransferase [Candidatus Omnitrophota bacterium]